MFIVTREQRKDTHLDVMLDDVIDVGFMVTLHQGAVKLSRSDWRWMSLSRSGASDR